jgi:hypothetical protein
MDKGHDNEKRGKTIGEMHQNREPRSSMSFLSSPVLQQSEEGWRVPEDGEVAGDGGGKDSVSFDRNRSMPLFRDVYAQGGRGGISTAVHHRVSEPMLFLQSGQGSGITARLYMTPLDPRAEYETALVLRL